MFLDPSFWLAISFFIFLGLMAKYVFPILTKAIDNKSIEIAKKLKEAKKMRDKAEDLLKASEKYQEESINYCKKLVEDAEIEARKLLENAQNSLEKELTKKTNLAKERIKLEEEKIIREIKTGIISSAIKIVEEKAAKYANKPSSTALDQAINNISKTIH